MQIRPYKGRKVTGTWENNHTKRAEFVPDFPTPTACSYCLKWFQSAEVRSSARSHARDACPRLEKGGPDEEYNELSPFGRWKWAKKIAQANDIPIPDFHRKLKPPKSLVRD